MTRILLILQALLLLSLCSLSRLRSTASAFAPTTTTTSRALLFATSSSPITTQLRSTTPDNNNNANTLDGLFKAGLLANCEEEAADLASQKIKSVKDLGWSQKAKRRPALIRPKYWAWGGADELPIQEKANYDASSSANCPEKWLTLEEFYALVKDDTAIADTVYVALAGGRAFVERDIAEGVLEEWYSTEGKRGKQQFNRDAFFKTVKKGQQDFLLGWGTFLGITGFAIAGIVFPTNPLQMALVNGLELLTGNVR